MELIQFLLLRTVAIIAFKGPRVFSDGSGVPFRLGDRYFLLTAGHVVSVLQLDNPEVEVRLHVTDKEHKFVLRWLRAGQGGHEDVADYGYIELHPECARSMEAFSKVFLSPKSFFMGQLKHDRCCLGGYPSSERSEHSNGSLSPRLCGVMAHPVTSSAPSTLPLPSQQVSYVDLYFPEDEMRKYDPTQEGSVEGEVPPLRGASGGGWWCSEREGGEPWRVPNLKLFGTHMGSGSDPGRYLRCVLISEHIKLLLEDYPDLAPVWAVSQLNTGASVDSQPPQNNPVKDIS